MPELPEVETVVNDLKQTAVGAKIVDFWENSPNQVVPNAVEVKKAVMGSKIVGIERKGKLIVLKLNYYSSSEARSLNGSSRRARLDSNNNIFLGIHLKMSGRLLLRKKEDAPDRFAHIIFSLKKIPKQVRDDNGEIWDDKGKVRDDNQELELRFCDTRKFGYIRLFRDKEEFMQQKLGPEPFSKKFSSAYLQKIFRHKNIKIKTALLDQKLIAGIGNIYANEALFLAKIRPTNESRNLEIKELRNLRESIIKVLKKGIKYRGSSSRDESYKDLFGELGSYQNHFLVYERKGKVCPNGCGGVIEYSKVNGRGTFWCNVCQK